MTVSVKAITLTEEYSEINYVPDVWVRKLIQMESQQMPVSCHCTYFNTLHAWTRNIALKLVPTVYGIIRENKPVLQSVDIFS
jgi:hypothetical protein